MFDRRGEDFESWHRTEQGAGRKMHDEAPSGRDLVRDGTDHPGIHEEPGEWDGLQTTYEIRRPFDSGKGSASEAMVESENEDPARASFEASLSPFNSEKGHVSLFACPFMESVDDV